jgi:hypothetical protein
MNKQLLGALSMDLKRVALDLHNGSPATALIFSDEAMKRIRELDNQKLPKQIKIVIEQVKQMFTIRDSERKAEYALMYSTIVQNYALSKLV